MASSARPALPTDRDRLVELMREFYAETGTPCDGPRTARAFEALLEDETLGRAWILERDGALAGYAVLTFGYSMQFGGRDAFVDDLFVREQHRGQGLGRAALETMTAECRTRGVRALHLEVDAENVPALALYRKLGFRDHAFRLMSIVLDEESADA